MMAGNEPPWRRGVTYSVAVTVRIIDANHALSGRTYRQECLCHIRFGKISRPLQIAMANVAQTLLSVLYCYRLLRASKTARAISSSSFVGITQTATWPEPMRRSSFDDALFAP